MICYCSIAPRAGGFSLLHTGSRTVAPRQVDAAKCMWRPIAPSAERPSRGAVALRYLKQHPAFTHGEQEGRGKHPGRESQAATEHIVLDQQKLGCAAILWMLRSEDHARIVVIRRWTGCGRPWNKHVRVGMAQLPVGLVRQSSRALHWKDVSRRLGWHVDAT